MKTEPRQVQAIQQQYSQCAMELGDIKHKLENEFPERQKNLMHQMSDLTREAKNAYEYWQKEEAKAKEEAALKQSPAAE